MPAPPVKPPCCICGAPSIGLHSKTAQEALTGEHGIVFRKETILRYFCNTHEREAHQQLLLALEKLDSDEP
jgi:hypothetical protein